MFTSYQIQRVGIYHDDGGEWVSDVNEADPRFVRACWGLYGRRPDEHGLLLAEHVADRETVEDAVALYTAITGVTNANDFDLNDLPATTNELWLINSKLIELSVAAEEREAEIAHSERISEAEDYHNLHLDLYRALDSIGRIVPGRA